MFQNIVGGGCSIAWGIWWKRASISCTIFKFPSRHANTWKKKSFECSEVTCNPILHIIARVRCYGVLLYTELSRTATVLWIEGWSYFIWFRELPRIIHHFRMSLMQHQSQHMNPNARQPHQPEALSVDLLICTKIQRLSMSSSEAVPSTDILKCMCFQSNFLFLCF